jgi:hypothetical protein
MVMDWLRSLVDWAAYCLYKLSLRRMSGRLYGWSTDYGIKHGLLVLNPRRYEPDEPMYIPKSTDTGER